MAAFFVATNACFFWPIPVARSPATAGVRVSTPQSGSGRTRLFRVEMAEIQTDSLLSTLSRPLTISNVTHR